MKVLVACEESQVVTLAFREFGHEAYSCDVLPAGGGYPEWHLQQDVIPLVGSREWDMIIAFPPCTHLCVSGARWFKQKQRSGQQKKAIKFFMSFVNAPCPEIAIENPVGIMSRIYRKPDQIVHPYWFGHGERKRTCLWLKNLPPLRPTNMVRGRHPKTHWMNPSEDRSKWRSRLCEGMAWAMAEQWTNI